MTALRQTAIRQCKGCFNPFRTNFVFLKLEQMHFVMDKGFYSEKGIAPLTNALMIGKNIYYAQTYIKKWNNRRVYYHVYSRKQ